MNCEAFCKIMVKIDFKWWTEGQPLVQSEGLSPNTMHLSLEASAAAICFLPACSESDFLRAEHSQLTPEDIAPEYQFNSIQFGHRCPPNLTWGTGWRARRTTHHVHAKCLFDQLEAWRLQFSGLRNNIWSVLIGCQELPLNRPNDNTV